LPSKALPLLFFFFNCPPPPLFPFFFNSPWWWPKLFLSSCNVILPLPPFYLFIFGFPFDGNQNHFNCHSTVVIEKVLIATWLRQQDRFQSPRDYGNRNLFNIKNLPLFFFFFPFFDSLPICFFFYFFWLPLMATQNVSIVM
jgi:hypothetical protein